MSDRYDPSAFTEDRPAPTAEDLAACLDPEPNGQLALEAFRPILDGSPNGSCAKLRESFVRRREASRPATKQLVHDLLALLGENPERQGLRETPRRVMESLHFLTDGYQADVGALIGTALFDAEGADEMIIVRDTEFYSLCEHHMLPFFGKVHVAYVPNDTIVGLSKIPRVIDVFAHRLQVQERLTTQIANALMEHLKPQGVAVVIEAQHLCMLMRGVQKYGSDTVTSAMTGGFKHNATTRNEFMAILREGRR